jgi:hypothetical protein
MQPESSDGLASVGTILPEETAAGFSAAVSRFGLVWETARERLLAGSLYALLISL